MERDGFGIDDTDTFLDQGLTLALAEARKSYSSEYVNRILVLTDGETRNAERCLEIAEDAVKDGISFSTFGVGTTWNEDLLTKISNLGQGNWYYIDEDQINRAEELFDQEFTGLQSTVLSNVVLHLRDLRPWTSVLRAQRVYPDIDELPFDTSAPNLVTVTVGTLQKNKEVYVLIDLKHNMAQNEGEYGLVKVSAHFDLPAQKLKDISTPEKEVRLNFIPGQRGASFDAEVAKFVRTVEINDGWKQVNELIAQGNKAEAARVLSKIHRISERTGDKEKTKFIGGAKDEFDETGTISKKTKLDVKDKARNTKVFKPEWEDEQE
jgi:Ca-activated chloride channel family protein